MEFIDNGTSTLGSIAIQVFENLTMPPLPKRSLNEFSMEIIKNNDNFLYQVKQNYEYEV